MKTLSFLNITLGVCQNLFAETQRIIDLENLNGVDVVSLPCDREKISQFGERDEELLKQEYDQFFFVCRYQEQVLQDGESNDSLFHSSCKVYLVGKNLLDWLRGQGGLLVTPGALRLWREQGRSGAQSISGNLLNDDLTKLILLDTGIDNKSSENLSLFAESCKIPAETIKVGLDYYRLFLKEFILTKKQELSLKDLNRVRLSFEPANSVKKIVQQIERFLSAALHIDDVVMQVIAKTNKQITFRGEKNFRDMESVINGEYSDTDFTYCDGFLVGDTFVCCAKFDNILTTEKREDIVNTLDLFGPLWATYINNAYLLERLARSDRQFTFLYKNAPLPYHLLGDDGLLLKVNRAWIDALGYSSIEVIGRKFSDFLTEDQQQHFQILLAQLQANGEVESVRLNVIKKNSSTISIELNGSAVLDRDTGGLMVHCIFQDVSGQEKIKEMIHQSEKLTTIASLAAGIAHEINTPLSGILQSVQLVEMFLDPEKEVNRQVAKENGIDLKKFQAYMQQQDLDYFIGGIRTAAIKASNIIKMLLDYSRPSQLERELVRLPHMIDSVIQLIHSDYGLKKKYRVIDTCFIKEYDEAIPFIECVAVEIEQVILGLISNAIHAMGIGKTVEPTVTIRTLALGENVRIQVEDNGPGMSTIVRNHAFDPFFTTKETGEGTGLGLSISYTIVVEKHKGQLWIDKEYSDGTRMVIDLPVSLQGEAVDG